MKVHEIMTGPARTVRPDTPLVEAAGLMRELDVGVLPVCDGDTVAGIVTDRDLVVRGLADARDPYSTPVSEVMSGAVESVRPDDDVEMAARIMEQHQIRRLPVLDRGDRLVGIVALGDIAISSNPAFGGMALRDVSQPARDSTRHQRMNRSSAPPPAPASGEARRGPQSGRSGISRRRGAAAPAQRARRTEAPAAKKHATAKAKSGVASGKAAAGMRGSHRRSSSRSRH